MGDAQLKTLPSKCAATPHSDRLKRRTHLIDAGHRINGKAQSTSPPSISIRILVKRRSAGDRRLALIVAFSGDMRSPIVLHVRGAHGTGVPAYKGLSIPPLLAAVYSSCATSCRLALITLVASPTPIITRDYTTPPYQPRFTWILLNPYSTLYLSGVRPPSRLRRSTPVFPLTKTTNTVVSPAIASWPKRPPLILKLFRILSRNESGSPNPFAAVFVSPSAIHRHLSLGLKEEDVVFIILCGGKKGSYPMVAHYYRRCIPIGVSRLSREVCIDISFAFKSYLAARDLPLCVLRAGIYREQDKVDASTALVSSFLGRFENRRHPASLHNTSSLSPNVLIALQSGF
ncbi:hypothetical protein EVG20_g9863 [Dentipellis fragilis]|uniref:Uncharacterized protein n=1 Tax=Dentipellis fragilis TaxID=205917 RepID=A0A4Y9XY32_9AGAM|nr:hypothetical protein EVG20_g9863 [Dentipellis fragilis]